MSYYKLKNSGGLIVIFLTEITMFLSVEIFLVQIQYTMQVPKNRVKLGLQINKEFKHISIIHSSEILPVCGKIVKNRFSFLKLRPVFLTYIWSSRSCIWEKSTIVGRYSDTLVVRLLVYHLQLNHCCRAILKLIRVLELFIFLVYCAIRDKSIREEIKKK